MDLWSYPGVFLRTYVLIQLEASWSANDTEMEQHTSRYHVLRRNLGGLFFQGLFVSYLETSDQLPQEIIVLDYVVL